MGHSAPAQPGSLSTALVAPCGMNCGVCIGYLRDRKTCPGCNDPDDSAKAYHCAACSIKRCEHLPSGSGGLCFACAKFPCARLRQLDKRYRTKYRMSMIENLEELRRTGVEYFVDLERTRWECPQCGALVSVHRTVCLACGASVEGTHGAGLTSASS